jgi:Ca2+-binding RTX toxin-like protein
MVNCANGFLGSLQVYGNAVSTTVTTGAEGAISIFTGRGADTITTGAGTVGSIFAGQGTDILAVGSGGVQFASMGDGDDAVVLTSLIQDFDVVIDGAAGSDGVDFSGNATGLTIVLNGTTRMTGAGTGTVIMTNVEAIVGTGFGDTLVGDNGANALTGGNGGDVLLGAGGADSFIFDGSDGTDQISDFAIGTDKIGFINGNFDDVVFENVFNGVVVTFQSTQVLVLNGTQFFVDNPANFFFF